MFKHTIEASQAPKSMVYFYMSGSQSVYSLSPQVRHPDQRVLADVARRREAGRPPSPQVCQHGPGPVPARTQQDLHQSPRVGTWALPSRLTSCSLPLYPALQQAERVTRFISWCRPGWRTRLPTLNVCWQARRLFVSRRKKKKNSPFLHRAP